MAGGRVVRLRREVVANRLPLHGLPSIPHDRAQEAEIRRRERPPEHRGFRQRRAAIVRVVHVRDGELRVRRDRQADADETLRQQEAERRTALARRGNVGVLTGRSVVGAENGIASARLLESLADSGRRDRPGLIRLVTGETAPPVRSQALEKRVVLVERSCRRDGALDAGSVAERQLIAAAFVGGGESDRRQPGEQTQRSKDTDTGSLSHSLAPSAGRYRQPKVWCRAAAIRYTAFDPRP